MGQEFKQKYAWSKRIRPIEAAEHGNEIVQRELCKSCFEECPAYQDWLKQKPQ